jgi:glycosyltransferase involved in cell wall biosynthesis
MTSARVSAVMPARNAARFIEQALRSILDQTVPPASIVVVDDGSTDETATIAGSLHPSITVVRRDHAGIGAARSAGVAATTTEFVAFLDADDLWLPHKLERQLALMDDDPSLDGVFCLLDEFYDPADLPPTSVRAPRLAVAAAAASSTGSGCSRAHRSESGSSGGPGRAPNGSVRSSSPRSSLAGVSTPATTRTCATTVARRSWRSHGPTGAPSAEKRSSGDRR